jgi:hypothetical protein
VKIQTRLFRIVFLSVVLAIGAMPLAAQDDLPKVGVAAARPMPIATGNNLYCAGYIQTAGISTENHIVGANDEADKHIYAQNDFLYINMGRNKGVKVGDMFSVVRPRGSVKGTWSHKSNLGYYVQEVGAVEVIEVKNQVSVAKVKTSCDNFLLGDLVQPVEKRVPPMFEQRPALDLFQNPSGKAQGRVIMARDGAEMIAKEFIVYVDLGAEDNVKVGDHITLFRDLGDGNPVRGPESEAVSARDFGFQSLKYKGGKFSNQAPRKSGEHAGGKEVSTAMAKDERPAFTETWHSLRKIVGEAVVINVKEKTATIVITRNAQEIHPGDGVELQ